ncbi:MAG TPA: PASTA domain-containing protein, partial [Gaiellaceae bacterium]|nr:PASTA domain-containing protein [Gaiellaceae bacterium]
MAARLTSLLPRVVALTAILVLASATISFAAENTLLAPAPAPEPAAVAPPLVTVPDVRGQAYVFAKGTLEEGGFAWRVTGPVQGYPANTVVSQTPAPGTRVIDTGLPTISLALERNNQYAQEGMPENASPYAGTRIRLLQRPKVEQGAAAKPKAKPAAKPKAKPAAKPKAKPAAKPIAKRAAKPKRKPVARPKPKPTATPPTKPSTGRPPAFTAAGAPKEPRDEIALPERARRLEAWLDRHPRPTNANVGHWLYQHEWIVTGARFGWWHGAEALEILIRVDERVQRRWGVGAKS